jgi:hypothetical protein
VTVVDTMAPALTGIPGNLTVTATSAAGAVVTWPAPTAVDFVSGSVPVTCTPASGSTFAVGTTAVTCTAADAAGHTATAGFSVTVAAAPPPPTGQLTVLYATLGGARFLDVDVFLFQGVKGETVTVRLAASPSGSFTGGPALLTLLGNGVLKADATTLPNAVTATLPATGTYYATVSELLGKSRFTGAYTLTLESTQNAWRTFAQK